MPSSLNLSTHHIFRPCLQTHHQPPQIIANPLQRHKTRKLKILACQTNQNLHESSTREKSIAEVGSSKETSFPQCGPPKFPSKDFKKKVAMVSFLGALGFLLATRLHLFGVPLKDHCAHALPSKEARPNGKSTVLQFYTDWGELGGEFAPDMYKVE